jgi:hypothetical protein
MWETYFRIRINIFVDFVKYMIDEKQVNLIGATSKAETAYNSGSP